MEEKERFELLKDNFTYIIIDNKTEKALMVYDICDLLNKQNKTIKKLGQSQKQLAIIELEKLKEVVDNKSLLAECIDDQIKELKGE